MTFTNLVRICDVSNKKMPSIPDLERQYEKRLYQPLKSKVQKGAALRLRKLLFVVWFPLILQGILEASLSYSSLMAILAVKLPEGSVVAWGLDLVNLAGNPRALQTRGLL